jgi:hypothetical protein
VGYDLRAAERRFLEVRVAAPARELEADLRHLGRDDHLAWDARQGCRRLADAVRGLLTWHGGIRGLAGEGLDGEIAKLRHYDDVLVVLQQTANPGRVALAAGDSCSAC